MDEYETEPLKAKYNADDVNPARSWSDEELFELAIPEIKKWEGYIPQTRIPTKGDKYTIGHGHTGRYAKPGASMTEEMADKVLREEDYPSHLKRIADMVPGFNQLPIDVAVQMAQSAFRGGITGSPDTVDFINERNFGKASEEFLDHDEYRNAKRTGTRAGIVPRMDNFSRTLKDHAKKPKLGMITGKPSYREL